jgi:hypothetical protein
MAITYELSIQNMDAAPTEGDLQDVVKIIHWMYIGKETVNGEDLYGDAIGAVEMNAPNSDSFTSFADLTEDQVKAWVESRYKGAHSKKNRSTKKSTNSNKIKSLGW